jgi:hypothetical protein
MEAVISNLKSGFEIGRPATGKAGNITDKKSIRALPVITSEL